MCRALFLALGVYCVVLGAECMVIDKAVLASRQERAPGFLGSNASLGRPRELTPPDWAPWSLMSAGAVTMLYSCTIPKRVKE